MEKKLKKLQLSKKTLRNLDDKILRDAAGGVTNTIVCSLCSLACSECTRVCGVCVP